MYVTRHLHRSSTSGFMHLLYRLEQRDPTGKGLHIPDLAVLLSSHPSPGRLMPRCYVLGMRSYLFHNSTLYCGQPASLVRRESLGVARKTGHPHPAGHQAVDPWQRT